MKEIIKVGVLIDSFDSSAWINEIISYIDNHPQYQIDVVVVNGGSNKPTASPPKIKRWAYRFLRKIDRLLFRVAADPFKRKPLSFKNNPLILTAKVRQTRFKDYFDQIVLRQIKQKELDIILRFGFRILAGDILACSKFGILSLHHGDADFNRGGPPAFWEVVLKEPVTGVTLQILNQELDGGSVLGKGYTRTQMYSFHRNQCAVFWLGVELMISQLNRIANKSIGLFFGEILNQEVVIRKYDRPLYRDPGIIQTVNAGSIILLRNLVSKVNSLFFRKQWVLLYDFQNNGGSSFVPYRFKQLDLPRDRIWADPFPVYENGKIYVFYEEKFWNSKHAHISCFQMDENGNKVLNSEQIVLSQNKHLSYPFIFSQDGKWYMLPESAESNEIALYECSNFPDQWEKRTVLISSIKAFDSTLFFHDGFWYLFCTVQQFSGSSPHTSLSIFYSDNLFTGDWISHPHNPVKLDVRGSRPAGRIFQHNGNWIRPAQEGAPLYGYAIQFYRIIKLSPLEYYEEFITRMEPKWDSKTIAAHTYNSSNQYTFIDAQIKKRRF